MTRCAFTKWGLWVIPVYPGDKFRLGPLSGRSPDVILTSQGRYAGHKRLSSLGVESTEATKMPLFLG